MTENQKKTLENCDLTVIVDRSGSMGTTEANGRTRWENAGEITVALTRKAMKFDPDGITLIDFDSSVHKVENATITTVEQLFADREPGTSTNFAGALAAGLAGFKERKTSGKLKPSGELFLVITDGVPDDAKAVETEIINATQVMTEDGDLGILIVQSGNDTSASTWLKKLDDDLTKAGAKFDCVDVIAMSDVGNRPLLDVILGAFQD